MDKPAARVIGKRPCKHCNGLERYASSRACVVCTIRRTDTRRRADWPAYLARQTEIRKEYNARPHVIARNRLSNQASYRRNPDLYKQHRDKRLGRIRELGHYKTSDIDNLRKAQHNRCYWCSVKLDASFHIDHVWPLSKGGSNGPENLCLACAPCNRKKGARLPWQFSDRLL